MIVTTPVLGTTQLNAHFSEGKQRCSLTRHITGQCGPTNWVKSPHTWPNKHPRFEEPLHEKWHKSNGEDKSWIHTWISPAFVANLGRKKAENKESRLSRFWWRWLAEISCKERGCPRRLIVVVILISNHAVWAGVRVAETPLAPRLAVSSGD